MSLVCRLWSLVVVGGVVAHPWLGVVNSVEAGRREQELHGTPGERTGATLRAGGGAGGSCDCCEVIVCVVCHAICVACLCVSLPGMW